MADENAAPESKAAEAGIISPEQAREMVGAETPATGEDALGDPGKQALDRMKAERNEATKQLKALQKELDGVRAASMSEAEKAVAEAEKRGRTAAISDFGQRLARAEFVAAAARRNPGFDAATVLDDLNLARYVTDDGEPDAAGIAAAVERLVQPASNPRPSGDADQGPRSTASDPGPGIARLRAAYASSSKST